MRFIEVPSVDDKNVFLSVDKIIAITKDEEGDTVLKLVDGTLFTPLTPDEILLKIRG
jgi:hypothetical protein